MKRIILLSVVLLLSVTSCTSKQCRPLEEYARTLKQAGMIYEYSPDYRIWQARSRWEYLPDHDKASTVNALAKLRNECLGDPVLYVYRSWTAHMLAESTEEAIGEGIQVGKVRLKVKGRWEEFLVVSPHYQEESTLEKQKELP